MAKLSYVAVIVGVISLIVGIISRLTLTPIVVEAQAFLQFTQACFLFAIAVSMAKLAGEKK